MASYSYDETGQYYFFLITFLTFLLVPWTYWSAFANGERATSKPPVAGWTRKHDSIRRSSSKSLGVTKSQVFLALGWLAFAFVLQRAYSYESDTKLYDPYEILGISTGLEEKAIKKHYKRLSIKFHPDKLRNADNQTFEAANAHFVELTKAYKALTDEVVRQNYEQYGHPDGKQEFSMGIALPKWIVESQNNGYVIALYGILFGIALPYFVGSWWYGSRRITKDGVLTTTAGLYFRDLKEDTTFEQMVEILSAGLAIDEPLNGVEESLTYKDVKKEVGAVLKAATGKALPTAAGTKTVATLLYAHLFRIEIHDTAVMRHKIRVVEKATSSTVSLMNIALSHSWLGAYLVASSLHQDLVQAVHPTLSPILQLPNITVPQARALNTAGGSSIPDFVKLDDKVRREALSDLSKTDYEHTLRVAQSFPILQVLDAKFVVVGEKTITPACFVQLSLQVKITPPSAASIPTLQINGETEELTTLEKGAEKDINELIGRKKAGALGEKPDLTVHAPYYPKSRKPAWYVFVGDHKLGRIFVPPTRFANFGYNTVRTIELMFQAPPNAGLYTFQAYIRSDSYIAADGQKDMMMQVQEPSADLQDAEDDISEPEEDSLAGQMAAMRGQPVKRIDGQNDDEEDDESSSGSDNESESSSSSDSDSD